MPSASSPRASSPHECSYSGYSRRRPKRWFRPTPIGYAALRAVSSFSSTDGSATTSPLSLVRSSPTTYIWNLDIKGVWHKVPLAVRVVIMSLPFLAFGMMLHDIPAFIDTFFHNDSVPLPLLIWGSAGQVIFTLRFIYQWYYSYRRRESILPVWFWIISLVGCSIIVSYGVFRLDPVLIIGQSVGFFTYSRNIVLYNKDKKATGKSAAEDGDKQY